MGAQEWPHQAHAFLLLTQPGYGWPAEGAHLHYASAKCPDQVERDESFEAIYIWTPAPIGIPGKIVFPPHRLCYGL